MSTQYADVRHPGTAVPAELRAWSAPWADYSPVDITPPELRRAGLAQAVAEGWAEPYPTPADVPDWAERQARANLPFDFDRDGNPLNPLGRTGRTGRNLGKWGENQAADPIVIAGTGPRRRVLLILRDDVRQWAFPGGMVDPDEFAPKALERELREETGVDLGALTPHVLTTGYVADWRTTDHAWVTTTAAVYQLPAEVVAVAADDAADARWWDFAYLESLESDLSKAGGLYEAHRPLLVLALDYLREQDEQREIVYSSRLPQ